MRGLSDHAHILAVAAGNALLCAGTALIVDASGDRDMALNRLSKSPHIYDIAASWRTDCLEDDGSIFTPGATVWARPVIDDLYERFVEHPDETSDTFMTKFERQLAGAPAETIQLAGEALFVHLMVSMNTNGDNKRHIINTVLSWSPAPVAMPAAFADALEHGLYGTGVGFNTHRPYFLRYVLELVRLVKTLDPETRHRRLSDPWTFRELVNEAPADHAPSQRDSVLHLVFPEYFETIASMDAKKQIAARFADLVSDPDADIDRRLYEIRQALIPKYGKDFDFWDDHIIREWRPSEEMKRWDTFVSWAKLFTERDDYDAEERNYKLEVADRLKGIRSMLLADDENWLPELKRAFGPPNNLTNWRMHDPFLKWCAADPEAASAMLARFWSEEGEAHERIAYFRATVPPKAQSSTSLPVPAFLLAALRPTEWPIYRATPFNAAFKLTAYEFPPTDDSAEKYDVALAFLDQLIEESATRGLKLRDRLDAQSAMWCVTNPKPPEDWPEAQKKQFLDYLQGVVQPEQELVEPFSTVFADLEEAEWAFGLLAHMADRLGLTGPDDPKFACTLRYRNRALHLNFCNWYVARFFAPGFRDKRVTFTIMKDRDDFGSLADRGLATKPGEPEASFASLSIDVARNMNPGQWAALNDTLDFMADRFAAQRACPFRDRYHVPAIGRAIFDPQFRIQLLTGNVDSGGPVQFGLKEMAEETGFSEAALKSWVSALKRKKQAILYGPPGTGKTYVARRLAKYLVANSEIDDGFFDLVQFHPAYAYEDFIQGIRPQTDEDGNLSYELERGRFLDFVDKASERTGTCVLIVDEINRANLARVFGELMYLLEYRDDEIALASGGTLHIPGNVCLIGTMNTADRSIALVDHALRRRFAFLELQPQYAVLEKFHDDRETGFPIDALLEVLAKVNGQIRNPHYFLGISFFLDEELGSTIENVWRTEIFPYLDEYFFDQPKVTEQFTWEAVRPQLGL